MTGFAARPVLETGPLMTTPVRGIAPGFGGSYASVLVDGQNPTLLLRHDLQRAGAAGEDGGGKEIGLGCTTSHFYNGWAWSPGGAIRTTLAGTPTATPPSGTSEITTAFRPITAWFPILIPPTMRAPAAIST